MLQSGNFLCFALRRKLTYYQRQLKLMKRIYTHEQTCKTSYAF